MTYKYTESQIQEIATFFETTVDTQDEFELDFFERHYLEAFNAFRKNICPKLKLRAALIEYDNCYIGEGPAEKVLKEYFEVDLAEINFVNWILAESIDWKNVQDILESENKLYVYGNDDHATFFYIGHLN